MEKVKKESYPSSLLVQASTGRNCQISIRYRYSFSFYIYTSNTIEISDAAKHESNNIQQNEK